MDSTNGYCYKILANLDYQSSAQTDCYNEFDGAELLVFNNDAEILGFLGLLAKGNCFYDLMGDAIAEWSKAVRDKTNEEPTRFQVCKLLVRSFHSFRVEKSIEKDLKRKN